MEYGGFHNFRINPEIKNLVSEIVLIESDNDSQELLSAGKIYSSELSIKPMVLHNKFHFTGHRMGREFPELLQEILK